MEIQESKEPSILKMNQLIKDTLSAEQQVSPQKKNHACCSPTSQTT